MHTSQKTAFFKKQEMFRKTNQVHTRYIGFYT